MFNQDFLLHQTLLADKIIAYKSYPVNAPVFHINEINSILLELVNENDDKENLSFIKETLVRFHLYSKLKQGEEVNGS